jgi:hypothetical protein
MVIRPNGLNIEQPAVPLRRRVMKFHAFELAGARIYSLWSQSPLHPPKISLVVVTEETGTQIVFGSRVARIQRGKKRGRKGKETGTQIVFGSRVARIQRA